MPEPHAGAWTGSQRRQVALLVVTALVLRVLYVLSMQDNPFFDAPILDSEYHVSYARALLHGDEAHHPGPFFRAPLYMWVLTGIFALLGEDLLAARLVQSLFGAATTLLTYLIGRTFVSHRAGLVAGWVAATYWVMIYYDGELLLESLSTPLNALALWLTLRLWRQPVARPWLAAALAGVAYGLAAITRPNIVLFLPVVALLLLWRPPLGAARRLPAVVGLTLGALLPIAPLTAWNTFVEGDFVLIASQGGSSLWIGNNPQSDGATAIIPGTRGGWWEGYHDSIALAEQDAGRPLQASEVSDWYAAKAWRWMREHPGDALALFVKKLRLLWADREIGNNHDLHFFAHRFSWLPQLLPMTFGFVAPLALIGIWWLRKRDPAWWLLVAYLVLYAATIVTFFVTARYRMQLLPVLFVFAAAAGLQAIALVRARRFRPLALGALVYLLGVWSCVAAWPPGMSTDDSNGLLQLGIAARRRDDHAAAERHLREALTVRGNNIFARIELARALAAQRKLRDAIEELRRALDLEPDRVDALEYLLALHFEHGQDYMLEQTARMFLAEQRFASLELPCYWLAALRHRQGQLTEAASLLDEALRRNPGSFRSAWLLGRIREQQQDRAGARAAYELALRNRLAALPAEIEAVEARLAELGR